MAPVCFEFLKSCYAGPPTLLSTVSLFSLIGLFNILKPVSGVSFRLFCLKHSCLQPALREMPISDRDHVCTCEGARWLKLGVISSVWLSSQSALPQGTPSLKTAHDRINTAKEIIIKQQQRNLNLI